MSTQLSGSARRVAAMLIAVVAAGLAMVTVGATTANAEDAPVVDQSFETGSGLPANWRFAEFVAGASRFVIANGAGFDGSHFLQIVSDKPNHARMVISVPVRADTTYRFRAMAKSSGTDPKQAAAVLGIDGVFSVTDSVRTDQDWQPLELLFKTGSQTSVDVALSLGYYGSSNVGTASFDAVTVTALAAPPGDKPVTDLTGAQAGGTAGTPARTATDTAAPDSSGPSSALWVVLAILVAGGIAVAVRLTRNRKGDTAGAGGDDDGSAEHDGDPGATEPAAAEAATVEGTPITSQGSIK